MRPYLWSVTTNKSVTWLLAKRKILHPGTFFFLLSLALDKGVFSELSFKIGFHYRYQWTCFGTYELRLRVLLQDQRLMLSEFLQHAAGLKSCLQTAVSLGSRPLLNLTASLFARE